MEKNVVGSGIDGIMRLIASVEDEWGIGCVIVGGLKRKAVIDFWECEGIFF